MKTEGEDAITKNVDNKIAPEGIEIWKHPNFVNKFTFKDEIEPLIEQFLKENLDVFETTVDIDGTNDLVPITVEENKVVEEVKTEEPIKIVYFEDYMNWLKSKGKNPKYKKVEDGLYEFDEHINFRYNNLDKASFKFVTKNNDKFYYRDIETEEQPTEEPEESIEDLIEGLKVMIEYSEGEEKEELENTIEGLKLLL
jgi:hypothetical protein